MENSSENKLELHYFFDKDDTTHSMDALVRNRCEHEILQIITTVSKELNIHIRTETEAYEEGGLTEFYTFIGSAEGQTIMAVSNLATTILGIVLSRIPLKKTELDLKDQQLSITERELNIEAQKLNIEILKKQLEEKNIQTPNISVEKIEYIINNNIKILKHKSNFYKSLYYYPKVKSISTVVLDQNREPIGKPQVIERNQFDKFVLETDNLEPLTDESALIEIISPVLKTGKYKWRGIYDKVASSIEFSMKDKGFKEDVVKDGISFKNGSFIDCILEIARKIDDLGNVYNSNYSVMTVLRHHNEGIVTETPQGKKHRQKKEGDQNQTRLFDGIND